MWPFYYFDFEKSYDVFKSKSPCILLKKNIHFNKNETQFGFRKNHNTQYCFTYMLEKQKNTHEKGKHVGAVFMDFSKAFDTINHDLLISELEACRFSTNALLFMLRYLKKKLKEYALIAHSALGWES